MTLFFQRLSTLCAENGIDMSSLGRLIGMPISRQTISRWRHGVIPRNSTMKAIADYFKVDVLWLYGEGEDVSENGDDNEGNNIEVNCGEITQPKRRLNCSACPQNTNCQCQLAADPMAKQILKMYNDASDVGKARIIHAVVDIWEQDQD